MNRPIHGASPGMRPPSRATILVVADDQLTALTLAKALEFGGYLVRIAATGSEACALLTRVRPDLIILDLMLPDTDGLVLTTTLKSMTDAPIIICSARHGQLDRVLGLRLGAADFVAKPVDLDDFQARIEAVLRSVPEGQAISLEPTRRRRRPQQQDQPR